MKVSLFTGPNAGFAMLFLESFLEAVEMVKEKLALRLLNDRSFAT